jgi:hypothetical protein
MHEEARRGVSEGQKLKTHGLPHNTVKRLLQSVVGDDIQLSAEGLETAAEIWQAEIEQWAQDYLLKELKEVNDNPNKPKGKSYKYRRITGLMILRSFRKWREGRES